VTIRPSISPAITDAQYPAIYILIVDDSNKVARRTVRAAYERDESEMRLIRGNEFALEMVRTFAGHSLINGHPQSRTM